jgi:alpha-ketoglutarate-dependent taurine dioxygenase
MKNQFITNPLKNIDQIKKSVKQHGIALFECDFEQEDFTEFGDLLGGVYKHRDSVTNGITVVKNTIDKSQSMSGYFGLTSSSLFPHTDRSTLDTPPNILLLYCKSQSGEGGESTLVDMKSVISEIANDSDFENHPIFEKNSVIFDDGRSCHKGSIIERIEDGSFYLRYRNDEFGYFNSKILHHLKRIEEVISNHRVLFKLKNNQGYIINNGRFLHGRTEFKGEREMWRLLVFDNFMEHKGFNLEKTYEYSQADSI